MAHLLKLDVFESDTAPSGPALLMPEELEHLRLSAYEDGYKAGWEDGCQQRLSDADQARERLAGQLESMNFAYAEAQAALLAGLRPVFTAVAQVFLPRAAQAAFAPLVAEALLRQAGLAMPARLVLRVAPDQVPQVQHALDGLALVPFDLVPDPELPVTQARLEAGAQHIAIDLSDACARIEKALADLYPAPLPEVHHA